MFYYKEAEFLIIYINDEGRRKVTSIRADNLTHATEKVEGLRSRYDWKAIKEIKSR